MDAAFKVDVLLHEYDSLRAEVLQRVRARYELLAFLGALAAVAAGIKDNRLLWAGVAALAALAVGVWFFWRAFIIRCSKRLEEIENTINGLTETSDDPLLVWETRQNKRRSKWHL